MIHYHGTPIGGKRDDVARFLRGRHALIPFGHTEDIGTASEVCQTFVIDNGAFSAWRSGTPIEDWSEYYQFVDEWRRHPAFVWAIIPDVIDGDEQQNNDLLAEWPYEECGVPVWHLHESLQRLEMLTSAYQIVALGSSGEYRTPGTESWWTRMQEAFECCTDDNGQPRAKLHGLRMLDPELFQYMPLASADSTNAAQNGSRTARRCGCNTLTGTTIIADRIESFQSAAKWTTRERQEVLWR
ncbi:MAG: hypothetical protein EBR82_78970 [Caulobacteraceae bacterium]|nr:hypothetical protein [Caulobacteraceae bacterium]